VFSLKEIKFVGVIERLHERVYGKDYGKII